MVALILALLLFDPTAAPSLADTVLILNSGSTNTSSFTVAVSRDGSLDIGIHGSVTKKHVSKKLANQLFADIARAGSLSALPQGHCMKSVSFGTETTIVYNGETSPDLSCVQSNIERILAADANAIIGAANINTTHKRSMLPGTRVPL
jgi:hypothetical protein